MKYHVNRKTKYLLLQCAVLTWLALPVCAADSPVGGGHLPYDRGYRRSGRRG
ncbi:hypothetical protein [Colibacter massiliensis]|uniref:hypothetical protein n=1 Tax=Colibacter massiliensis TaxID=1852379 RepID=UPI00266DAB12|nr:hypothetical protein [Colibacter massiliensis]